MSGAPRSRVGWGWALLAALLTLTGSGCGGYRLGPSNGVSARGQSVYVQPFLNDTLQPGLEDNLTHAMRIGLQREGTYRLGSRGDCDIVLEGVVKSYTRQGLSYNPSDLVQVVDYSLIAVAQITAYDRRTGKKMLDRGFSGSTQVQAGQDLTSAERQAMPMLANDMALKVVDALADGSW